jgi:hypothetical protein
MQKTTLRTISRQFDEIKKRLQIVDYSVIEKIASANNETAKILIYYSIIKTYKIFYDFILEVVRPKVLVFDYKLLDLDFDKFLRYKSEMVPGIDKLSSSTKAKIKQVFFRILHEVGIIDSTRTKIVTPIRIQESIIHLIVKDNPKYLSGFLIPDFDIKYYKEKYLKNAY